MKRCPFTYSTTLQLIGEAAELNFGCAPVAEKIGCFGLES